MFLIVQRLRKGPLRTSESKNVPLASDNQSSADFAESDSLHFNIFPKYDSLRLLDAHLIFEPLLSSLGVMPQQMVNPNSGNYFIIIMCVSFYFVLKNHSSLYLSFKNLCFPKLSNIMVSLSKMYDDLKQFKF